MSDGKASQRMDGEFSYRCFPSLPRLRHLYARIIWDHVELIFRERALHKVLHSTVIRDAPVPLSYLHNWKSGEHDRRKRVDSASTFSMSLLRVVFFSDWTFFWRGSTCLVKGRHDLEDGRASAGAWMKFRSRTWRLSPFPHDDLSRRGSLIRIRGWTGGHRHQWTADRR